MNCIIIIINECGTMKQKGCSCGCQVKLRSQMSCKPAEGQILDVLVFEKKKFAHDTANVVTAATMQE